ncbi:MAG: aminotransferase class I/II-fold pyridoxal phosphate-dependent enzyme [Candidatus Omnitrophica bacterium COP1]|nr:aminotransferase class I/II-fold pyridoxal phosphate-dependent enzyme [Candidatus Omnitrophica bacterium COP1]
MKLAQRMDRIDSSGIRKVFALAANMKNPCNLSIGQPDFELPAELQDAARKAIESGHNRYTQTGGIQALKDKVRQKLPDKKGIDKDGILITSGTSGGLMLAFMTLFDPGDEVIVPEPYFVMYKHLLNLIGAVPVYVDLYPDFHLTAERIRPHLTPRTRAILVNSPANPTGVVSSQSELEGISVYENTLVLGGFSKTYAMTGWRLGYAVGNAELIAAMEELQQYSFVCAPSVAQHMGVVALDLDMRPYWEAYRHKRDLIYEGIRESFKVSRPGGAFYIFPEAPDGDGDAFCARAIEQSLLIVPGSVFSERKSHFRISFAGTDDTICRGVEILNKLAKG